LASACCSGRRFVFQAGEEMETSEKTAWLSLGTNAALVGLKAVLAVLSGSLAIQADAIHSLSDVFSSLVILTGIKISGRRSRRFPYGLYKVENLVALGVSLVIFIAGYEVAREVFTGASRIRPAHIPLATAGIGLTILITWQFSRYELKKGLETGSPSLVADARHIWTDTLSSGVILVSLLGSALGFPLDRYAALVVVAFIARAAFGIFLEAVRVLLDASLDFESLDRIRETVLADVRVGKINELRARNAGRFKFVELDLTLRVRELERGHQAAEEIKKRIQQNLKNVDHVSVHYEPERKVHHTLGMPLCDDRLTLSDHFGEAPFFRLRTVRLKDGAVTEDSILGNPFAHEDKGKGIKVANWLLERGLDQIILTRDLGGKGSGLALANAGTEIIVVAEKDAKKVLASAANGWKTRKVAPGG
jgi:cation diffusion facilitator family transporter